MSRFIIISLIAVSLYGWFFVFKHSDDISRVPVIEQGEESVKDSSQTLVGLFTQTDVETNVVDYKVTKVVDGDTITVEKAGQKETVRMIGVDTPETVHPSKAVECFGTEASNKTKDWLNDEKVSLEFDPTQGERDKYGRLLAYVFRSDGLFINKELIAAGFAYEYTYNLPYKYQTEFKQAEESARLNGVGLWASGACTEADHTSHTDRQSTSPIYEEGHVDKDCGDFSNQADAQSYFEAGGGSPTYNYDRLDGDQDGVVCESLAS